MPRPRSLSPAVIAHAALTVLDREGAVGLSMRTVAAELGVSTMALYKYVTGRQHLERLVVELVLDPVEAEVPPAAPWADRVTLLVLRLRDAASAHPPAIPLLLAHRQTATRSLQWMESMLAALTDAGFTGRKRVVAQRTVVNYLIGAVQTEYLAALAAAGTEAMAALPTDSFPHLASTARAARTVSPADEFRQGLAIVLDGLTAALRN
ncbi:TetR family transcriptional regulator [Micromonospora sp. KC606]|uniref:TetR/AcrR family transcriptional regulator n=1 Tax=Micromonospora sp. KC606 TaxID=2530379 RepID=UPI00104837A5|nr:TetR/AcrR family transcriptional regulator C-terminal domain-containing protein [Micromonospora sp. KC606]TDC80760.1 TetR family transcriptional regulator [Micromonospora sp. KC606]